jgi:hypothetical protein
MFYRDMIAAEWVTRNKDNVCGQSAGLLVLSSKVNALTADLEMLSSSMLLKARKCFQWQVQVFSEALLFDWMYESGRGGRVCIRK